MVNPPRDEIPRIRLRLQEYGPVGDANVFYWFQNRKARSKNKPRAARGGARSAHLPSRAPPARHAAAPLVTPPPQLAPRIQTQQQAVQLLASPVPQRQAPTSSSSSSSDLSSGSSRPATTKPAAAQAMSATEAMDLLGPLAAACPQVYNHGHQPVASSPKSQQDHLAAADEAISLPWQQGYCLSAAELAAILGAQYRHVPAVQQHTPAVPLLGLCNNEVAAPPPTINGGHRSCANWAQGLGQCWPSGTADHHQLCKNTTAASNTVVTKEVAHEADATKPGLLQYDFGVSAAMDVVSSAVVTLPLSSPSDAAVTVASVAAATAGLTGGLAATTAANGFVTGFDQFQGM
jgi:hypothetical protein